MIVDKNKHKALLFDFDGTLVNSEPLHYESFVIILKKFNIDFISFKEHCQAYLGKGSKTILSAELKKHNKEADIDELIIEKKALFKELQHKKGLQSIPGAIDFLLLCKKDNFKMALVSGGLKESIRNSMESAAIPDVFDILISSEDVTKTKPDPECFLKAAEFLNVDPKDCLVFEDALNGIHAGQSAGMHCCALTTYVEKERFLEIDKEIAVVRDFTEVQITE